MNDEINDRLRRLGDRRAPARPSAPPSQPSPPAGVAPYRPFPVNALPDGLREYVVNQAAALGCDPVFVALHALTVAGAAAGNSLVIQLKRGFEQPPLIWGCVVADSGTGKSPGLQPPLWSAIAVNKRLKVKYEAAMKEHKLRLEQWEACENPDPEAKPVPPVEQTFVIEDITIEELICTASDSTHGLVMIHDEMTSFFHMMVRYTAKSGGSELGKYLKAYDAGWTDYRRKTGDRRRVTCERTFLALSGGIQPAVLKSHLSKNQTAHVHSGMAARFLFVMPPKRCLRWTEREPSQELEIRFRDIVYALADLPYDERTGPTAVRPQSTAMRVYTGRYDLNAEQAENHDGGPMSAVLPKASGQAARLALIHFAVTEATASRDPGKGTIPEESMAAGVELAEWFVHEAGRVYAMLAESDEDRADRDLCGLIARKGGSISVRELQRCNRTGCETTAACELQLCALMTAGRGEWRQVPSENGGRATRRFVLFATGGGSTLDTGPGAD